MNESYNPKRFTKILNEFLIKMNIIYLIES
jgi:hypothetical protein